jgi:hypothetical protein
MQERRAAKRLRIDRDARWEGLRTEGRGAICDLSSLGCFVLTSGEVRSGELIRLKINSPQERASLWGQVVYAVAEIGFAMRFAFGRDDGRILDELIKGLESQVVGQ